MNGQTSPSPAGGALRLPDGTVVPNARTSPLTEASHAQTLESIDPELAGALAVLARRATAENHLAAAGAYFRAGILDQAYDHYAEAARLAPADAAAYDHMARIWLLWRCPQFGLGNAHRAVFLAPRSPIPLNTLGTLLLASGLRDDAQQAFERALRLDGGAAYALQNLCALLTSGDGRPEAAVTACALGMRIGPMTAATGRGIELHRLGAAQLASCRYADAAAAFTEAERCLRDGQCPPHSSDRGPGGLGDDHGAR